MQITKSSPLFLCCAVLFFVGSCDFGPPAAECGNGVVEMGEQCDGGGGDSFDCNKDCTVALCGDGYVNSAAGETCESSGVDTDTCDADCTAPQCGDGHANNAAGEACDTGGSDTSDCDADCTAVSCGDGYLNTAAGEACDSSGVDTDACDADCTLPTCGDGYTNTSAGETCDGQGIDTGDCDKDCTAAECGDGYLNTASGEGCDEGVNNSNSVADACRTTCVSASCGDGVVDDLELCDNGAANSDSVADACRINCRPAGCGDSVVDNGEDCDTGAVDAVDCDNDCTSVVCGDGHVNADAGETCDAVNLPTIDCDTDCSAQSCGDGLLNTAAGEICDNGAANSNTTADACRLDCTAPACGDGVVDTNEDCDDGNTTSGDGCGFFCKSEYRVNIDAALGAAYAGMPVTALLYSAGKPSGHLVARVRYYTWSFNTDAAGAFQAALKTVEQCGDGVDAWVPAGDYNLHFYINSDGAAKSEMMYGCSDKMYNAAHGFRTAITVSNADVTVPIAAGDLQTAVVQGFSVTAPVGVSAVTCELHDPGATTPFYSYVPDQNRITAFSAVLSGAATAVDSQRLLPGFYHLYCKSTQGTAASLTQPNYDLSQAPTASALPLALQ